MARRAEGGGCSAQVGAGVGCKMLNVPFEFPENQGVILGSDVGFLRLLANVLNIKKCLDDEGRAKGPAAKETIERGCDCKCDPAHPKSIVIVLIAPKPGDLRPPPSCPCFKLKFLVFFDHEDLIPNPKARGNGYFDKDYWSKTFGGGDNTIQDMNLGGMFSHGGDEAFGHWLHRNYGWRGLRNNHGGLLGGLTGSHGRTNIEDKADEAISDGADFGIVAHSQGANIALNALQQLCATVVPTPRDTNGTR